MNQQKPDLSIVTRVSRGETFVRRVLEGILKQTRVNIEWVIVTATSLSADHESCFAVARSNNINVITVAAEAGMSLGKLANLGVRASNGQFVLLLDDDDTLRIDFVGLAMKILGQSDGYAIACHTAIVFESENKDELITVLSPGKNEVQYKTIISKNVIATNGLIYRRLVFDAVGGYREDVDVAEDWLFNLSILREGKILILNKVGSTAYQRSVHRQHPSSNTSQEAHILMANKIRSSLGGDQDLEISNYEMLWEKIKRKIDRITYKFGGWFVPR